jgi:hypothetical protein
MATDSLTAALVALQYPHVRKRVRHGDLTVFEPHLDLTPEEIDLVRAAADDFGGPSYDAAGSAMFRAVAAAEAAEDDTSGFAMMAAPLSALRGISIPSGMLTAGTGGMAPQTSAGTSPTNPRNYTFPGSCCCPPSS